MLLEGLVYFLRTYWIFIGLALVMGLAAGWFSYASDEEAESGEGE